MTLNPIPETTAHIINGGTNMTVRANIERAIGQPLPAVGQFNPWTSNIPKLPLDQYTGEIRRDCYDIAREAGRRAASLGLVGMQLDWDVIRPIRSFADWLIRKSVSSDHRTAPIEFLPAKHLGEYRAAMLAGATHGVVIKRERTRSTLLTAYIALATELAQLLTDGLRDGLEEGGVVDPHVSIWGWPSAKQIKAEDVEYWGAASDAFSNCSHICATVYYEGDPNTLADRTKWAIQSASAARKPGQTVALCVRALVPPGGIGAPMNPMFAFEWERIIPAAKSVWPEGEPFVVFLWESKPWGEDGGPDRWNGPVALGCEKLMERLRHHFPAPKPRSKVASVDAGGATVQDGHVAGVKPGPKYDPYNDVLSLRQRLFEASLDVNEIINAMRAERRKELSDGHDME
jgi:hypothetical protein